MRAAGDGALMSLIMSLLLALTMAFTPGMASTVPNAQPAAPAPLTIFLVDKCGGCGVDSPGCGNCEDTVIYHGVVKEQLGDRLYNGSIEYRMLNCKMLANDALADEYAEAFDVSDDVRKRLPLIFIGEAGNGVYIFGEEGLSIIAEVMDKYQAGMDTEALQQEIDTWRAEHQ